VESERFLRDQKGGAGTFDVPFMMHNEPGGIGEAQSITLSIGEPMGDQESLYLRDEERQTKLSEDSRDSCKLEL